MSQILEEHFGFPVDPFNPAEDPETGFSFETYSLRNGLPIFQEQKLAKYFIEEGCFKEAMGRARQFIARRQPNEGPPVFLIQGLRDSGVESLTSYVALEIARRAPGKNTSFEVVPLAGESYAEWLSNILLPVRLHIEKYRVPGAEALLPLFPNPLAAAIPSESGLSQFMTTLAPRMKAAPWLILALNSISYEKQNEVKRLADLLVPMNISPIFITSDAKVTRFFEATFRNRAQALKLETLDALQAMDILKARIGLFRKQTPVGREVIFPYEEDAVRYLFSDGGKVIGYFLDACWGTLAMKTDEIAAGGNPSPTVTWEYMKRYVEEILMQDAPRRRA